MSSLDESDQDSNQELNQKDYYLLDSFNKIKQYKIADPNDSDIIFLRYYKEQKGIIEEIYNIKNFKNSYNFIQIKTANEKPRTIGFLLPKNKLKNEMTVKVLSNEIKKSKFIKEISHSLNLDLTKDNFNLKKSDSDNVIILTKIIDNKNIKNKSTKKYSNLTKLKANNIKIIKPDSHNNRLNNSSFINYGQNVPNIIYNNYNNGNIINNNIYKNNKLNNSFTNSNYKKDKLNSSFINIDNKKKK